MSEFRKHWRSRAVCFFILGVFVVAVGCDRPGNRVVESSGATSPESIAEQLVAERAASEAGREK